MTWVRPGRRHPAARPRRRQVARARFRRTLAGTPVALIGAALVGIVVTVALAASVIAP